MFVVPLLISLHLWFGNVYCWINQPIGSELCKRQCCNNVGSTQCGYQLTLMKCLLTTGNGESNADITRLNYTQMCNFQIINQNGKCSKIVRTRKKGTICIKQSILDSSVVSGGRNVRVIMTDHNKRDFANYIQIHMKNQSVTGYDFLQTRLVIALAYVKSFKRLIVVTEVPSFIDSYSLDKYDNRRGVLLQQTDGLTVIALVAEDLLKPYKLYFTTNKNELHKMTVFGSRQKIVGVRVNKAIFSITIDPYKKILYACQRSQVLRVPLKSSPGFRRSETIMRSKTAVYTAVSFNKAERSLYYNDDRVLYRKLSDGRISKALFLAKPIRQISCNGETVYVSYRPYDYSKLSVIDIRTGEHQLVDLSSHFSHQFSFTMVY